MAACRLQSRIGAHFLIFSKHLFLSHLSISWASTMKWAPYYMLGDSSVSRSKIWLSEHFLYLNTSSTLPTLIHGTCSARDPWGSKGKTSGLVERAHFSRRGWFSKSETPSCPKLSDFVPSRMKYWRSTDFGAKVRLQLGFAIYKLSNFEKCT